MAAATLAHDARHPTTAVITSLLRPVMGRVVTPLATGLLRAGVTPDAVTAAGTVGVMAGALALWATGHFLAGTAVITLFVLTDVLDGTMARTLGTTSRYGAWLDSTCDRAADAAVFGSLAWWFAHGGDDSLGQALALVVLVTSSLVSYAKARAQGLGFSCDVGIAERTERLVVVLAAGFALGLGAPGTVMVVALAVLAVLTLVTVGQRAREVRRQATLLGP